MASFFHRICVKIANGYNNNVSIKYSMYDVKSGEAAIRSVENIQ